MKRYRITIPAFIEDIMAENEEEALEIFWFDFDSAQREAELMRPQVREVRRLTEKNKRVK